MANLLGFLELRLVSTASGKPYCCVKSLLVFLAGLFWKEISSAGRRARAGARGYLLYGNLEVDAAGATFIGIKPNTRRRSGSRLTQGVDRARLCALSMSYSSACDDGRTGNYQG